MVGSRDITNATTIHVMMQDFTCFDTYEFSGHESELPFADVGLTIFHASRDKKVSSDMVAGWNRFFGGDSRTAKAHGEPVRIDGHHLFPYEPQAKQDWLLHITRELARILASPPPQLYSAKFAVNRDRKATRSVGQGQASGSNRFCVRWALNIRNWQPTDKEWQFVLSLLPAHEQERVQKFRFPKDQKLALGSR
eukprot:SAG31_NODE_3624_length_4058_cov_2.587270_2_plen_194_part_00